KMVLIAEEFEPYAIPNGRADLKRRSIMATEIAKQLGNERKQEREQNQKERQSELHTDMAAELREERAEEREQERVAELREERAMPRKFDNVWPMIDANYQNNVPHLLRKVLVYLACHTDFNDAA